MPSRRELYASRPARIAGLTEQDLRECPRLSREKHPGHGALVASGTPDLEQWRRCPTNLAFPTCELPASAQKSPIVCAVRLRAAARVYDRCLDRARLKEKIFPQTEVTRTVRRFARLFRRGRRYAQQYSFHHARKGGRRLLAGDLRMIRSANADYGKRTAPEVGSASSFALAAIWR